MKMRRSIQALSGALFAAFAAAAQATGVEAVAPPPIQPLSYRLEEGAAPQAAAPDLTEGPVGRGEKSGDYDSFGERLGIVKWEVATAAAVITIANLPIVIREPQPFRFTSEPLFSDSNPSRGMDKMAHAWHGYVFTDILYQRMAQKTGGGRETALTAAALGLGLQTLGELYDGVHRGSGFSFEDMAFNAAGVGLSVARQTIPGLGDKIDFRLMITPNSEVVSFRGKRHWQQQRYLLALRPSGFSGLRNSPLRFVEFQAGYHVEDLVAASRDPSISPKRKVFVGIGLDLSELLLKNKRGKAASLGRTALHYLQIPYTAVHSN